MLNLSCGTWRIHVCQRLPCSPLFLGNKRRKKSREGEKSLEEEEGSEQPSVTS